MSVSFKRKVLEALHLGQALGLVWQSSPGWTMARGGLLLVLGVLPLAGLYLNKLLVDGVARGVTAADRTAAFRQILLLIGFVG